MTSGSILYCATHVDDLIFGYNNKKLFKEIMDSIGKELTIGVLEKLETVIGLRIIRDRKNRTM